MSRRGTYTSDTHQVSTAALRSEQMCNYDMDDLDHRWLSAFNGERAMMGNATITELEMEKSMEELERQSWVKINQSVKQTEEEDQEDSVVCNVCRSVSQKYVSSMKIVALMFNFSHSSSSLCPKIETGWSSATVATSVFTRRATASPPFLQVHGSAGLAR